MIFRRHILRISGSKPSLGGVNACCGFISDLARKGLPGRNIMLDRTFKSSAARPLGGVSVFPARYFRCVLLAVAAAETLRADVLYLSNESRMTGEVRAIGPAGVIELATGLSPDPVLLKAEALAKIEFSAPAEAGSKSGALVELTNGDLLPATIGGLEGETLNVLTASAGPLAIPRSALKSMRLGVHERKVIYSGPRNGAEWTRDGDAAKNWRFASGALTANGPASVSRNFEIPLQFVFKFTLSWQGSPAFLIYFADPLTPKAERTDRYNFQFNRAGLEIKRESSQGKRLESVILLTRTPDQFPDKKLDVEIRVDRKTSRIHLVLDGEPEGAGIDPVPDPPSGGGVSLVNESPVGLLQKIQSIELCELDRAASQRVEDEREDSKSDRLISRDDDGWGGRLFGILPRGDGPIFSFKADSGEEPFELPEAEVSRIFFGRTDALENPVSPSPYILRMHDGGVLRLASCVFSEDQITAEHSLLGLLQINRAGVSILERPDSKPQPKAEP